MYNWFIVFRLDQDLKSDLGRAFNAETRQVQQQVQKSFSDIGKQEFSLECANELLR